MAHFSYTEPEEEIVERDESLGCAVCHSVLREAAKCPGCSQPFCRVRGAAVAIRRLA